MGIIIINASQQQVLSPQSLAAQLSSKLNFWYSADHLTIINGLVADATDLTGNGRHGVQNTIANRLNYFASDPLFGGRPSFGSTTNIGNRHLITPSAAVRHQLFSAYYKDGIDNTFDTFSIFSGGTSSNAAPRIMGNSGTSNLISTSAFSATISKGGAPASAVILPLPATTLVASGSGFGSLILHIGGSGLSAGVDRVLVGAFRHFVTASAVLTTQEIQLIEGVIAWNDGTQNTLIPGHPYRNAPPTS